MSSDTVELLTSLGGEIDGTSAVDLPCDLGGFLFDRSLERVSEAERCRRVLLDGIDDKLGKSFCALPTFAKGGVQIGSDLVWTPVTGNGLVSRLLLQI